MVKAGGTGNFRLAHKLRSTYEDSRAALRLGVLLSLEAIRWASDGGPHGTWLQDCRIEKSGNLECGGRVPSLRDSDTALDQSFTATLLRIQSAFAAALCRRTPNEIQLTFRRRRGKRLTERHSVVCSD